MVTRIRESVILNKMRAKALRDEVLGLHEEGLEDETLRSPTLPPEAVPPLSDRQIRYDICIQARRDHALSEETLSYKSLSKQPSFPEPTSPKQLPAQMTLLKDIPTQTLPMRAPPSMPSHEVSCSELTPPELAPPKDAAASNIPTQKPPPKHPPPLRITRNQIFSHLKSDGTDQITILIRNAAERHRHSSLCNFTSELSILPPEEYLSSLPAFTDPTNRAAHPKLYLHPPALAPSIRDTSNKFLGWESYYFDISGAQDSEPKPFEIRLLPPASLRHDVGVRVKYGRKWMKISSFLNTYPPARRLNSWTMEQTPQAQWESQWRWWHALARLPDCNSMRKTFRLLDLPAEIREVIYGKVLGGVLHPFPKLGCRRLSGLTQERFVAAQPNIQLLLGLNKQIFREASRVLFSDTVWLVPHRAILGEICLKKNFCNRVQRLHLTLSHGEFIRLFYPDEGQSMIEFVRTMRLKSLVLDIEAPAKRFGVWEGGEERRVVCQKLMVDWILEGAKSWAAGHEGVKVVGYVKDQQKKEFEEMCWKECKEFRKWKEVFGGDEGLEEWDKWRGGDGREFEKWVELDEANERLEEWEAWKKDDGGVSVGEAVAEEGEEEVVEGEDSGDEGEEEQTLENYRYRGVTPECFCEVSCGVEDWSFKG